MTHLPGLFATSANDGDTAHELEMHVQGNFVVEPDSATAPRLRVIDFSEAPALLDPASRATIPGSFLRSSG